VLLWIIDTNHFFLSVGREKSEYFTGTNIAYLFNMNPADNKTVKKMTLGCRDMSWQYMIRFEYS